MPVVNTEIVLDEKETKQLITILDKSFFIFCDNLKAEMKPVMRTVNKTAKHKLRKGKGVEKGIYKKSVKQFDNSQLRLGYFEYQVAAKPMHYRLTHLLENGHRIVSHGKDTGKRTKPIPHMIYGQNEADSKVLPAIKRAIEKTFKGE